MVCRHCGYENYPDMRLCARCGEPMRRPGQSLLALLWPSRAPASALQGAGKNAGLTGWTGTSASLDRLWDGLSGNSSLMFAALGTVALTVGVAFLAHGSLPPAQRLSVAGLFALSWAILFALTPLLLRFAAVAIAVLVVAGAAFLITQFGVGLATAVFYAVMAVALLGVLILLLPFVPGLLAAVAIYRLMGGTPTGLILASAGLVVTTGAVFAAWATFTHFVIPFSRGFFWAFASGAVAHRIAFSAVTGSHAAEWISLLSTLPRSAADALAALPRLVQTLLLVDRVPGMLWVWLLAVASVVGVFSIMHLTMED